MAYDIIGEEKEESTWIPSIIMSDIKHNGLRVNINPPYPGADSHHICVQNPLYIYKCIKEIFRIKMPSVSKFIEIPNNRTYRILVRPYDEYDDALFKWMPASSPIFLPPFDTELSTIGIPVESPGENITEDTHFSHKPNNIALIASLSCLAVIALVLIISILLNNFLKRNNQHAYNVEIGDKPDMSKTMPGSRGPVKITPLYLDSSGMVDAHLEILENQPDITIERVNVDQMHGNIEDWLNTQIDSLTKHDNHEILVYASDNMKITFTEPDMFHDQPEDQICVRFIQMLRQNQKIKPYVACFGEQTYLEDSPPLIWFPDQTIIPVIKYKSDGSVSFDGTLDLIRRILSIDEASRVSLDSTDTHHLQELFQNIHSNNTSLKYNSGPLSRL